MAKCASCGERKGDRLCPRLKASLCSLCCGTKREKEILCVETCESLKRGKDYQLNREIEKRISSDLHAETADIFERDEVAVFPMALEKFFVDRFYGDKEARDDDIYKALTKIYAFQKGILADLEGENKFEKSVFKKFNEVDRQFSSLSAELKAKAILRMIKSVRSSSSSVLGNRNYLEMIYSQHTGKGKWAELFQKLEPEG
ncbi:MAG TPA: hypothetical protein VLZ10_15640 [Thermodesulfobacteriota bacterium]|nr:hypothetical protein [Thermodesulfobacteriota bacterium]